MTSVRSSFATSNNYSKEEDSAISPSSSTSNQATTSTGTQQNNLLELVGVIGFNGGVRGGLILHPGDRHLIYPLGSTIVVRDLYNNTQTFLQKNGHDRAVSCLALSATGKYLASGQVTHMGFNALVIIWNLETYEIVHKLVLHKGKIEDLAFSPHEKYLVTLGGRDDNKIVVWDVNTGEAICGATAANETAHTVRFFNHSDDYLVTGGNYNLKVWYLDHANRKVRPSDCQLGQMKRVINSIVIDDEDKYMYCGTQTGDLLQVSLGPNLFKMSGPSKKAFQLGISCVMKTRKGNIVVGAGDGTIALLKSDTLQIIRKTRLNGGVTSLVLNANGDHFFAGTDKCNIYLVHLQSFEYELRNTCHNGKIYDIAFPYNYSELFATCSNSDIRIWNSRTKNELLRINVPNLTCLCVCFTSDGKSIISGWDDGKIRAFGPQSGKLLYVINDAHLGGVTAIACTQSSSEYKRIISGGEGGQVRVWAIERGNQRMIASMKEHKGRVNRIQITNDDSECVSASSDGSCIVWSLKRFMRNTVLFASTQFRSIVYHPDQSQLLTTGTDRKLTYWDVVDGNPIRILDGSVSDVLNCLAITSDGDKFVCAGGDKQVKVWAYDEGRCFYRGIGHSGEITQCVVSPDQKMIVTCGEEGAIFLWKMPEVRFGQEDVDDNETNDIYNNNNNTRAPSSASSSSRRSHPQESSSHSALHQLAKANPTPQQLEDSVATSGGSSGGAYSSSSFVSNDGETKDSETQQSLASGAPTGTSTGTSSSRFPSSSARVTASRGTYSTAAVQKKSSSRVPSAGTASVRRTK